MRYFVCFLALLIIPAAQAYEFDNKPITDCWGVIDFSAYDENSDTFYFADENGQNACVNADSLGRERNFFAKEVIKDVEIINETMQAKIKPLWLDNDGHHETLVREGAHLYRTYNYCLESLCRQVLRDCGAENNNADAQRDYNRCVVRKDRLLDLTQAQLEVALKGNLNRKKRDLFVGKYSSLALRFDKFFHPRLSAVNRHIANTERALNALVRKTWTEK